MGVTIANGFSGMDNAFFRGLEARGLLAGVCHAEVPAAWRAALLAATFRWPKSRWYHAWQRSLMKTPRAFALRTRAAEGQLRKRMGSFDVVLQAGGLFAPFRGEFPRPVALICDYTTRLAERNYPPWFGLAPEDAAVWYDLERSLYERAARVFTASENTRRSIIADYGLAPDRVRVIGEGVPRVVEHPGKRYDQKTVLMVGIDFDRKGGPTLLRAFRYVRQQVPEARLLVVGPASGPEQPGVEWLGHISDRERLDGIYGQATVFAMPSLCEPFGLALVEAMAHGLPVVGSTADAMAEIVGEGEHGYLVAPNDAEGLAERLLELLSSPELCARLGEAGRERVRRQFLWSHAVDRLLSGLQEIAPAS